MAITRIDRFNPDVPYYTGAGCLVCGTNLGPQIWTGIDDDVDGRISVCHDHAREIGLKVGMVDGEEIVVADERVEAAKAMLEEAREAQAEAARDLATVKRLIGPKPAKAPRQ